MGKKEIMEPDLIKNTQNQSAVTEQPEKVVNLSTKLERRRRIEELNEERRMREELIMI